MPKGLRLGMGLSKPARTSGGAPAFTPASLFTGTDEGFWAPVTTARLWQDTARTTPVTTSGDPIASWQLTTRTGVIYATQSNTSLRPTYNVDGNGRGRIQFGSGSFLATPTITPPGDVCQVFLTHSIVTSDTRCLVEMSNTSDSNAGSFFLYQLFGNTRFRTRGTNSSESLSGTPTPPTQEYLTCLGNIGGDSGILRRNGTQVASDTADQGTGNYLAYPIFIGARGNGSLGTDGAFYGLIVRFGPALTAGQITDTEAWMDDLRNP